MNSHTKRLFPVAIGSRWSTTTALDLVRSWAWLSVLFLAVTVFANRLGAAEGSLAIVAPAGYVPGLPVLLRLELRQPDGARERLIWDAEASLTVAQSGVTLSTNRVFLRNGMGSTLVTFEGADGSVEVVAQVYGRTAQKTFTRVNPQPTLSISGSLPDDATWSGVVAVTNDVIVPANRVLTIMPGTWVLLRGVASGTNGADLQINGELRVLGTAEAPVVITCASPDLRWGQIRHAGAQPSVYQNAMITLGGRGRGEGHTGQTPVIRSSNSRIAFTDCSITDHATAAGTPGKIMQAINSSLTMTNCLLSRARMGPEIEGTSIQFIDCYIIDMRGPDDADGIYLHSQATGQQIRLAGSVVAGGDDDGIDTLGANMSVDNCIVRGWRYPGDDSKGISVFGGEVRVTHCLLADNTIGLSGKGGSNENVRVRIDHCTIIGNSYGVAVTNKSGTLPIIDYRITNSIILGPDAVFTQYEPADIHIDYSLVGEAWPGTGNVTGDPGFVDAVASDFRLAPFSICIDGANPLSPGDPDGSPGDIGWSTFVPPAPSLGGPMEFVGGSFGLMLMGYTNRNYVLESSTNLVNWSGGVTQFQATASTRIVDPGSGATGSRFYRARLAP